MRKTIVTMLIASMILLVGTTVTVQAFQIVTRNMLAEERVTETDLIPTVDNFIVLFDTSASTNEAVPGKTISKIMAAKNMLKSRNAWLPDLGYNAGLYIYTNTASLQGDFKTVYDLKPYDRDAFGHAIDQLPEKGEGPALLRSGLNALRKLMSGVTGKTAIIAFTDGAFTVNRGPQKPLQMAQEIARDHDVCFYLISSADADGEKMLVDSVAKINACSRVVPLATFLDNPHYIGGALYTTRTTAYSRMKPVTKVLGIVTEDILFPTNSTKISDEYHATLDRVAKYMQANPDAYMVASGYSDNVGKEEHNMWLSQRRATHVKNYLIDHYGIDMDRVVDLWFGDLNPVGDNATEAGRRLNRRVEIAIGGVN